MTDENQQLTPEQALDKIMELFREVKVREIRMQRMAAQYGPQVIPFRAGDLVTSTEYKGQLKVVAVEYEAINGKITGMASVCKLRKDGADANKFYKTNASTLTKVG